MNKRTPLLLTVLVLWLAAGIAPSQASAPAGGADLPPGFEENLGQLDGEFRYLVRDGGYALGFGPDRIQIHPVGSSAGRDLSLRLAGANPFPGLSGGAVLPGAVHYLVGADPEGWITGVRTFSSVRYGSVYDDVDLVIGGQRGALALEFQLAPAVDPEVLVLEIEGGEPPELGSDGELGLGDGIRLRAPEILQLTAEGPLPVAGRFILLDGGRIGIAMEDRDPDLPIQIRIGLDGQSSFSMRRGSEEKLDLAVAAGGDVLIAGRTAPYGSGEAYVTRLTNRESAVVFTTWFGGAGVDVPLGVALDGSGRAVVVGSTGSGIDFPSTVESADSPGGAQDAFVVTLSEDGSRLVQAQRFGGSGQDAARAAGVGADGSVWIAGDTEGGLPVGEESFDPVATGAGEAWLARSPADGSGISFVTYLGGSGTETAAALAVGRAGEILVAGITDSADFPLLDPLQPDRASERAEIYLVKLTSDGELLYSTYLGGPAAEQAVDLAVAPGGSIFVTGWSEAVGSRPAALQESSDERERKAGRAAIRESARAAGDAFVVRIDPEGVAATWSSPLGVTEDQRSRAIAVDDAGRLWIAGATGSAELPTLDARQPSLGGEEDAFVATLGPDGEELLGSTYIGGVEFDSAQAIALDGGSALVLGSSSSGELPGAKIVGSDASGQSVFLARMGAAESSALAAGCPGTINFDNSAGNGLWQELTNWDTDVLPTSTDDVCIDGFAVTVSSGTQNAGTLYVSATGSLAISGGTLNLVSTSEIHSDFAMSGGTLGGSGAVAFAGGFDWSGGGLSGSGEVLVNGAVDISGASSKTVTGRTLRNTSTASWSGAGQVYVGQGSAFVNDGTWDVTNDVWMRNNYGGSASFTNNGTFGKSAGAGQTRLSVTFNNHGTVDVQSGSLRIDAGGDSTGSFGGAGTLAFYGGTQTLQAASTLGVANVTAASGTVNVLGEFDVSGTLTGSGATMTLDTGVTVTSIGDLVVSGGSVSFGSGVDLSSMGSVSISGGTANFNNGATASASSLTISGGTLGGSGVVAFAGGFDWSGGGLSGSGEVLVNGAVDISGASSKTVTGRTLRNTSTASWSGAGQMYVGQGSTFINDGTWDVTNDVWMRNNYGGSASFTNNGTFGKSAGAGQTRLSVTFNNHGTVDVQSGSLRIDAGGDSTGSFGGAGTLAFYGGTQTLQAASTLGVANVTAASGTVNVLGEFDVSGTLTASGATMTLDTGVTVTSIGDLVVSGGSVSFGSGVDLSSMGSVSISGGTANFNNGATASASSLTISGGTLGGSGVVAFAGGFDWSGGGLSGSGEVLVNGAVDISGASSKTVTGRTLRNTSTASWSGTGQMYVGQGSTFINDGTWDVTNDVWMRNNYGGSASFTNNGTFGKSAGAGQTRLSVTFNNHGTVDVQSGSLRIDAGGDSTGSFGGAGTLAFYGGTQTLQAASTLGVANVTAASGTVNVLGEFDVSGTLTASGATMTLDTGVTVTSIGDLVVSGGSVSFGSGVDLSSMGSVSISGGTANFNNGATASASSLTISGGTLGGSGVVAFAGGFDWSGGGLSGSGEVLVNGAVDISGASSKTVTGRTLRNTSTASWSGTGQMYVGQGSTFINDGTWDVTNDVWMRNNYGGSASFTNNGTFGKSAGAGQTRLSVTFNNHGTVDVQSGSLRIDAGGDSTGSFGGAGTLAFYGGTQTLQAASTLGVANVTAASGTVNVLGEFDVSGTLTASGATMTLDTGVTVTSIGDLVVSGGSVSFGSGVDLSSMGSVSISGGTANFNNGATASASSLTISGGTLGGSGVVAFAGGFDWSGGGLSGSGEVLVNGAVDISGASSKTVTGRTLRNTSTASWSGTGQMYVGQGSTFINDGTWDVTNDVWMRNNYGGSASFTNNGTFGKSAGAGQTRLSVTFNNHGTVDVQSGSLRIDAGGDSTGSFGGAGTLAFYGGTQTLQAASTLGVANVTAASGTVNVLGEFDVSGTLTASGATMTLDTGVTVTSIGDLVVSGGSVSFGSGVDLSSMGSVSISGGTANFNNGATASASSLTISGGTLGGSGVVAFAGGFDWSGGGLSGSGEVLVNGAVDISGASSKTVTGRTLRNTSTASWSGTGQMYVGQGSTFINDGTWDVTNDVWMRNNYGGSATITNNGIFRKSAGAGTTRLSAGFVNTGVVELLAGTLNAEAGYSQTAGSTMLNGGSLTSSSTLDIQGGTLGGIGSVGTSVSNAGSTAPGLSAGILGVNGQYSQTAAGGLAIELGGLTAGTGHDKLEVVSSALLDGVLNVTLINGYLPVEGDSFTILAASGVSGTFAAVNTPVLPGGEPWQVIYGADSVVLTVGATCPDVDDDGYALCDGGCVLSTGDECGDCDDGDAEINPGVAELTCDGIDQNCNGAADDTPDADSDGYSVCDECDDGDAGINPGAAELTCDGIDQNCNGAADDTPDADSDGFTVCDECDDGDAATYPGAAELCDGLDNDCDESVPANEADADSDGYRICEGDCDDTAAGTNPGLVESPPFCEDGEDNDCDGDVDYDDPTCQGVCPDTDSDGFAVCDLTCAPAMGNQCGDCDDADAASHPGAAELCDGIDNDCDGSVPANEADGDSDGYRVCDGDCDDGSGSVHPGAEELCDGIDNDCDGSTPANESDGDSDGYRVCDGDCDDGSGSSYPGAEELCDGADNDCDGSTPANESDGDSDGYRVCDGDCDDGSGSTYPGAEELCDGADNDCDGSTPANESDGDSDGYRVCENDCDDGSGSTHPGAAELCDGVDNDCDGSVPADESDGDEDGYRICDGDCNDGSGSAYPGASEICDDGIDNDCDGYADASDTDCGVGPRTICSTLGDQPADQELDEDSYTFSGMVDEEVDLLAIATNGFGTANLILVDAISGDGTVLHEVDRSRFPNRITVTLPATGDYFIAVSEQPDLALVSGRRFAGDYCLTLSSSRGASLTLQATGSVEPGDAAAAAQQSVQPGRAPRALRDPEIGARTRGR